MSTASFEVVSRPAEGKHHDRQLCYEIMDELRSCALHCRSSAEKVAHLGTRIGLNSVALLLDSGLSALKQCLQLVHPGENRHLEEITEEAIETVETSEVDWRPGGASRSRHLSSQEKEAK